MTDGDEQPSDAAAPSSESGALVRLGMKIALGKRGEYLAEYLDDRRMRRVSHRLARLGEWAQTAGASVDDVVQRVESDDEAAEVIEHIVEVAVGSRYEPKLRYLARCLANFINGGDAASPDLTFAKVSAIEDLEAIHVRLLYGVKHAQDQREASVPRGAFVHASVLQVVEADLVERDGFTSGGIPPSSFDAVMAVLTRTGLVAAQAEIDVEVEVDLDAEGGVAETSPSASTRMVYRVTGLGLEVLDALEVAVEQ
jgi:hypothetical protein